MRTISINRIVGVLLFVACCFPYISPIDTPFDTQPYAIALAGVIIILFFFANKDFPIPKMLIPFLLIFLYSILLLLMSNDIGMGFRSIVGYGSVILISLAAFATFKHVRGKHFIFVVSVWLFFGLVQLLVDKSFGSFMLSRLSTSESRGITSLAAEPSFYSIICIFLFVLNDLFYSKKEYSKRMYSFIFLLLFVQLILSQTGVGFMLFLVYLIAKMVSQLDFKRTVKQFFALGVVGAVFIGLFQMVDSLKYSRLGSLIDVGLSNPTLLLFTDGSVADRAVHIILSHASLLFSYGIGFGLGNWGDHSEELATRVGGITLDIARVNMTEEGRIMSGWGTPIFEIGIFGLLFMLTFLFIMIRGFKTVDTSLKSVYLSSFITIYFVMLNAVPIAFPLFGYVVGVFTYEQIKGKYARKRNPELAVQ